MAKKKPAATADTAKPVFVAQVRYGGASFGTETASLGIKMPESAVRTEKHRGFFIKKQLKVILSTDPNPPDQASLPGMDEPYEKVTVIATVNSIAMNDSEVTSRLKMQKNAVRPEFLSQLPGTQGTIRIMEIMEAQADSDSDDSGEE